MTGMSVTMIYITGHVIQMDGSRKNGPQEVHTLVGYAIDQVPPLVRAYESRHGECSSFDVVIVK